MLFEYNGRIYSPIKKQSGYWVDGKRLLSSFDNPHELFLITRPFWPVTAKGFPDGNIFYLTSTPSANEFVIMEPYTQGSFNEKRLQMLLEKKYALWEENVSTNQYETSIAIPLYAVAFREIAEEYPPKNGIYCLANNLKSLSTDWPGIWILEETKTHQVLPYPPNDAPLYGTLCWQYNKSYSLQSEVWFAWTTFWQKIETAVLSQDIPTGQNGAHIIILMFIIFSSTQNETVKTEFSSAVLSHRLKFYMKHIPNTEKIYEEIVKILHATDPQTAPIRYQRICQILKELENLSAAKKFPVAPVTSTDEQIIYLIQNGCHAVNKKGLEAVIATTKQHDRTLYNFTTIDNSSLTTRSQTFDSIENLIDEMLNFAPLTSWHEIR